MALLVAGAVVGLIAVARASTGMLALAALLMVAGVVASALVAWRRIPRRGWRVPAVVAAVASTAAVLVPASMNVDPCTRVGHGADLAGCDLSGRDLSGEDLAGADLSGADLRGTDLSSSVLATADLRRAMLADADLAEADLGDAVLVEADLRGADLARADLAGTDLTDADVADAAAAAVDLSDATLAGADLTGADLTGATLAGADLTGADLTEATLDEADLDSVDMTGATLSRVVATEATLDDARLVGADLTDADLTAAAAPGADFRDAVLSGTRLGANDLRGVENLPNAALAAALDVPEAALPGATARRGIVFDDRLAIVDAVAPVADGRAVPEAQPYRPSERFHPAVVLDGHGDTSWLDDVDEAWAPTGLRFAQLVIVVAPERHEPVEECSGYVYSDDGTPAPDVVRYVTTVRVRVYSAHGAKLVGERTFRGGDPRSCQLNETEIQGVAAIYGDDPDLDAEAQPWLAGLVRAPDERAEPLPPRQRDDPGAIEA